MPSRTDAHHHHYHEACGTNKEIRFSPQPCMVAKSFVECSTRHRHRRTRFISGSAGETGGSTLIEEECVVRTRRCSAAHVEPRSPRTLAKHNKSTISPASSPRSLIRPLSRDVSMVLDTFNSQDGATMNEVVDENSFSSSVFSDHLVQSDIPLVIKSAKGASTTHSSLLTHGDLRDPDSAIRDLKRSEMVKDMKADVASLFIHEDSVVSTPTLATADDAGSSEGEDDGDGKEPTDDLQLSVDQSGESELVPVSKALHAVDDCSFTQGLPLLDNRSFNHMHTVSACGPSYPVPCCSVPAPSPLNHSDLVDTNDPVSNGTVTNIVHSPITVISSPTSRMITRSQAATWLKRTNMSSNASSSSSLLILPNNVDSHMLVTIDATACITNPTSTSTTKDTIDIPSVTEQSGSNLGSLCDARSSTVTPPLALSQSPISSYTSRIRSSLNACLLNRTTDTVNFVDTTDRNEFSTSNPVGVTSFRSDTGLPSTVVNPIGSSNNKSLPQAVFHCSSNSVIKDKNAAEFGLTNSAPCCVSPSVLTNSSNSSNTSPGSPEGDEAPHVYPLRSRLRREALLRQIPTPKQFSTLPTEVLLRIVHYLNIQDVFRLQLVSRRLKSVVERYLLLVKRINFSNGLPFAFLPESINDIILKRILSRTPEVTHILGFYPRVIAVSRSFGPNRSPRLSGMMNLTYNGIVSAFRICSKLRSVELMDVELMSKLVHHLPRIKFHGMFRNRPDSWDCEYAVPLPPEPSGNENTQSNVVTAGAVGSQNVSSDALTECHLSSLMCSITALASVSSVYSIERRKRRHPRDLDFNTVSRQCRAALPQLCKPSREVPMNNSAGDSFSKEVSGLARQCISNCSGLASWFDPKGEYPTGQGSPSCPPYVLLSRPTCLTNRFIPWHEYMRLNFPYVQQQFLVLVEFLQNLRRLILAPAMHVGLPAIEAEVIPVEDYISNQSELNDSFNAPFSLLALTYCAIVISRYFLGSRSDTSVFITRTAMTDQSFVLLNRLNNSEDALPGARHIPNALSFMPFLRLVRQAIQLGRDRVQAAAAAAALALQGNPDARYVRYVNDPAAVHPPQVDHTNANRNETDRRKWNAHGPWLVSPFSNQLKAVQLPYSIANLTKLDLVSVTISKLPRLDNIKYLHLKWVTFETNRPFEVFSAPKLQSFVMNNCNSSFRTAADIARLFTSLSRAPQLSRLELVGVQFVDGLFRPMIDECLLAGRGFRHLQRLVLASNRNSTTLDVGLLLVMGQQSLNHVALPTTHSCNELFRAISQTQIQFPRLESVILGYQDPYRSRLTVSELESLHLSEPSDYSLPFCNITDAGMLVLFEILNRLSTITIRHAPYLRNLHFWYNSNASPSVCRSLAANASSSDVCLPVHDGPQLRSLTLEDCPGILCEDLQNALTTGHPFPVLETLVLRDMFAPRYHRSLGFMVDELRSCHSASTVHTSTYQSEARLVDIDWRKVGQMLALSDFLAVHRIGHSSLASESIGLSAPIREVQNANPLPFHRAAELPVQSFDLFYSLRSYYYLNSLLELDGSCDPLSVDRPSAAWNFFSNHSSDVENCVIGRVQEPSSIHTESDFISQSSQTCICGLLEYEVLHKLSITNASTSLSSVSPESTSSSSMSTASGSTQNRLPSRILGGTLAAHPHAVSTWTHHLSALINTSTWTNFIASQPMIKELLDSNASSIVPSEIQHCNGCSGESISATTPEHSLRHRTRFWSARDACVDTSELRCHTLPLPLPLKIYQPIDGTKSNLTSIHLENVGITHLVLTEAPRLKSITLENCPQLQAILFSPLICSTNSDFGMGTELHRNSWLPSLRRIRIVRCPKFAIYNLLHSVAVLYPGHDENISITYRPFGYYNEQVERALWDHAHFAHLLVSHDYKQTASERSMEETQSMFDQLFRDVMNFADVLIHRDLLISTPNVCTSEWQPASFRRCENGTDWNLITDIPWIHEVCCSALKRRGESHRSNDQTEQFYELLSEVHTSFNQVKFQRRGIHLHVQLRDVDLLGSPAHDSSSGNSDPWSAPVVSHIHHSWAYSELYLSSTHPAEDFNAWNDGFNEDDLALLPPPPQIDWSTSSQPQLQTDLLPWQRLLLSQEEFGPGVDGDLTGQGIPHSSFMTPTHLSSSAPSGSKRTYFIGCDSNSLSCFRRPSTNKRSRLSVDRVSAVTRSQAASISDKFSHSSLNRKRKSAFPVCASATPIGKLKKPKF